MEWIRNRSGSMDSIWSGDYRVIKSGDSIYQVYKMNPSGRVLMLGRNVTTSGEAKDICERHAIIQETIDD